MKYLEWKTVNNLEKEPEIHRPRETNQVATSLGNGPEQLRRNRKFRRRNVNKQQERGKSWFNNQKNKKGAAGNDLIVTGRFNLAIRFIRFNNCIYTQGRNYPAERRNSGSFYCCWC